MSERALKAVQQRSLLCYVYHFFPLAGDSLPCVNGKSSANLSAAAEEANSRRATILITIHKFLVHSICRQYKNRVAAGVSGGGSLRRINEQETDDSAVHRCCRSIFFASEYFMRHRESPEVLYTLIKRMNQVCRLYQLPASTATQNFSPLCTHNWVHAPKLLVSWDFISLAFWICLLLKRKSKF